MKAHIINHTHWDREWRYPLWQTRLMLVDFLDELIRLMEEGKCDSFLMDGQAAPILDYLEMRPEMQERVKSLIGSGKLEIGPWYTLPDEYPVDGEALVRNLVWGHRAAGELGGVLKVGYTSFGWGQTAQLAQIYGGFGFDTAFIGKRVSSKRAPQSEFLWRSPDGTELITSRFGGLGRQNLYLKLHMSALLGVNWETNEWKEAGLRTGIVFHQCDREQMEQDFFRIDHPREFHPEMITPQRVESLWKTMDESLLSNDRLMMNGCDYTAYQPLFHDILERIKQVDPVKGRDWQVTTLSRYAELMRQKIDPASLNVVDGELRDGPAITVTGNALATRMHLKRLNKEAQNWLLRTAEPLSVMSSIIAEPPRREFLDMAWKFLLQSHPHDSINGVTQDETVSNVEDRLHQVIDLSKTVSSDAMAGILKTVDLSDFSKEDVLIAVFNTSPYEQDEVVDAWINMPLQDESSEQIPPPDGLQIYNADGSPADTQWLGCSDESYPVAQLHARPMGFKSKRHHLLFRTGPIKGCGYKIFKAAAIDYDSVKNVAWADVDSRTGNVLKSPNTLENEFFKVKMNSNGTFDLADKRLGKTFSGLNYFEDRGELGTYWSNRRPHEDRVYTSLGANAAVWAKENGPLQATLVSEVVMNIPVSGLRSLDKRSDQLKPLTLRTEVTLKSGCERVDVAVEFENNHEDHYLRVMLPTGIEKAEYADAGGHFIVDRRPIRPAGPSDEAVWPDMATLPQNQFVDLSDGESGFAVINDCFTEYEVLDNEERTLALSLLRSVQNWICTERVPSVYPSQKGGQCLGRHSYRYAIMPHKGSLHESKAALAGELFNTPLRPIQTNGHTGRLRSLDFSSLSLSNPQLRVSTVKPAEQRPTVVLRLYNPTGEKQKTQIRTAADIKEAWQVSLNEDRLGTLDVSGKSVTVELEPYKIATFEIDAGN
ncbi:Mannosylglycerate hydrolase [Limihaloglobus sulfuriphilus]|uniref:Mannosylglycerate hydrolase n=1 Tax=Limihaloglobus sulfuriphilus TaxID=1851148 RepID=A0A1Q2MI20_9BACT|nr:glycoside hydrolase family 38 C-terminal domain-containing protein [Limihaloglobus sulfuriphilus]AQQ72330.1 Mannosylglycerate hydrolase [Limihaloglobus sulfuriphilus]